MRRAAYMEMVVGIIQLVLVMSVKPMTVKQAEKWLEKLKGQNMQSYKAISKSLRSYEKNQDDHDCYIKVSHALLAHSDLTKELNNYMEEPNKFIISKSEEDKIKDFMAYVKKHHFAAFEKIIAMIQELSKTKGGDPVEISKSLRPRLSGIVEGDRELERVTEEALDLSGEELISRKNLEHLRSLKETQPIKEETQQVRPKHEPKQQQTAKELKYFQDIGRQTGGGRYTKQVLIGPFANPSEEKSIIRQLQKMVDESSYAYIIKVTNLYTLNIITRNEAFDVLGGIQADELYLECLRDILDCRQTERRKNSVFRPLNDMNFSNCERASPSYVTMPLYYPTLCKSKPEWIKAITNESWVSVPYGSEESENFSVRNKNSNQINLLKAEDERYQFDLYMKRLVKSLELLEHLLDENSNFDEAAREKIIKKIVGLGSLQTLYKNCHRDQKEELEWYLRTIDLQTCKVFKERVQAQVNELRNIKEVHAIKNWSEVANKNFFKALDLKGFEFKKNEKEKMKAAFFLSQLQERHKLMDNSGQNKNGIIFEEKKQFFTVLNSFESSSRTEKCLTRKLPQIETFDLQDEKSKHRYPMIIMAFEDKEVCQNIYSLLLFYIDSFPMTVPEQYKLKCYLEEFLVEYLGWEVPQKKSLNSEKFDEQKFYAKVAGSQEPVDINSWINKDPPESLMQDGKQKEPKGQKEEKGQKDKISMLKLLKDKPSPYSYLPIQSEEKKVLYGSEHLYTLSRFIYALYERMIRMKEVAENQQKIDLFYILLYACVRTKQSSKFEQNLNFLFGKYAYLFSTIYKLLDNLIKSLGAFSNCPLAFEFFGMADDQDLYFLQLNRLCLNNGLTNVKLIRLTYNKADRVLYVNHLDSYYKSDDSGKDMVKKRGDISKGIEIYTVDNYGLGDKKRRKLNEVLENSELEYIFEGNTIKMLNHGQNEDLMQFIGRKQIFSKTIKRELKRAHRMWGRSH